MKRRSDISFKVKLTPKRSLIAVLVASVLSFIAVRCEVSKDELLKWYSEIRRLIKWDLPDEFINEFDNQLNERINQDPKLLEHKIRREVDETIRTYEAEEQRNHTTNMKNKNILEEINKDKYDKLQKLIVKDAVYYEFADGTMGIRGAWVPPDPREIPLN